MQSGGYNNNSNNKKSKGSFLPSAFMKMGNSLKNKGKKTLGRAGRSLILNGGKFGKLAILGAVIFIFFIIFASSCSFLFSGEDDGKSQNYIDYNNYTSQDGEVNLSPANETVKAYYHLVSKNRSVWQEKVGDNGEKELILSSHEDAVSDYFKNDRKYYIQPDLLFVMNDVVFGEDYVYPEAFLKPVYYDETTYDLKTLVDDNGNVCVTSKEPNTNKEYNSVADYGIGTVMSYKKVSKTSTKRFIVDKKDVLDETTGMVTQVTLDTPIEYDPEVVSSTEYDVLDMVVSFDKKVDYEYKAVYYKTGELGETKRLVETKIVSGYECRANYSTSVPPVYKAPSEAEEFCKNNNYYIVKDGEGNPIMSSTTVDLYEYYSDDSGIYMSFVTPETPVETEFGYDYFNTYLYNFSTHRPAIERTYDVFRNFSSAPSLSNLQHSINSNGGEGAVAGAGDTDFEKFYNGNKKETIERIYDALILWGYTEEQACAVLGNVTQESDFDTGVVNAESGAYGLAQWTEGRQSQLENFAQTHNGTDKSDLTSQIQYLCMEVDSKNNYAYLGENQWSVYPSYRNLWETSSDLDELTEAMAIGWERYATPNELEASAKHQADLRTRQANTRSAYEILAGRTVEYNIEIIPCSSASGGEIQKTVASTSKMSKEDSETFNKFYNVVDRIEEENINCEYYYKPLGSNDVEYIFAQTNTYLYGTLLSEEEQKQFDELVAEGYFTDLKEKQRIILGNNGSKAELIIENAQLHIGEGGEYAWAMFGGGTGEAWCSMFVYSLFKEANMLYAVGYEEGSSSVGGVGYGLAHSYLQWAMLSPETRLVYCNPPIFNVGNAEEFNLEGYEDGQYGDIAIFEWADGGYGGDYADHVGLIISYEGNGTYLTIEGNTDGGVVALKTRNITDGSNGIIAIVRPEYNIVSDNSKEK